MSAKKRISRAGAAEGLPAKVLDRSPVGILRSTRRGRMLYVNERLCTMLGLSREELLGSPAERIYFDPQDRRLLAGQMESQGFLRDAEIRLRHASGRIIHALLTTIDVESDDSADPERVTWVYDETERRHILENVQVGIALSGDGRILKCNPRFLENFRFASEADIVGKPSAVMFPSEQDYARFGERVGPLLAAGKTVDLEWLMRRADGTDAWMHVAAKPLPDTGEAYRTVWMLADIDARKRADAVLQAAAEGERHASAQLKALFDSSPLGVVIRRPATSYVEYANASVLRMLDCTFEQYAAWDPRKQYVDPSARGRIIEDLQRTGQALGREVAYRRFNGGIFWALVSFEMIEWEGGPAMVSWVADITERKEAEAAVRAAGEAQRALLESAPAGIAFIKDRVVERCNGRLEQMFGYGPGELVGTPTRAWYADEDAYRSSGEEAYPRLARGETYVRERQFLRKDGTSFWCRVSARAFDPAQPASGSVWTLEDVSAERADADALKQALARLEAIFASATAGMALITNRVFVKCNRRLEEILGEPPGGLDGQSVRRLYPSDEDYEDSGSRVYPQLTRGETHRTGGRVRRADGTMVWARFSGRAIDPSDLSRGAVWSIEDVTEEREAEEALKNALEQQTAILENANVGIALIKNGILTRCNRKLERIFGYGPGELTGRHVRVFYADESGYREALAGSRELLQRGEQQRLEQPVQRKDGSILWCRAYVLAVDPADLARGIVAVFEDVTEQRAAAEALRIAKEAAEAATGAKSTFLATMSHEIRTPMNGVLGMLELLQRTPLDARQRELTDVIRESASSLLKIIDDILDFSKIESGRLEIECVPMAPLLLVEGVAEMLAAEAHKKRLRLVAFVDGSVPPMVGGDPVRLRQILFNIVGNAIKFTERGEVVVRVSVDSSTPEGMRLRAQVSDTGIGLSREAQERLFQPFVQAEGSTTRRFGGTGLGLSICKGLAERMGGAIGVTSAPGEGSTFWFTMLVRPSNAAAPDDPDLSGLHVLVVERRGVVRDLLVAYLSSAGARVDSVASGEAAVDLMVRQTASNGSVDAVVMAQTLSGGAALPRALSAQPSLRAVPCLLIAPFEEAGLRAEALAAGFAGYLVNPVRRAVLLRAVAVACGRQAAAEPAIAADAGLREPPERDAALAGGRLVLVAEDNVTNRLVVSRQLAQLGYAVDVAENGRDALELFRRFAYALVLTDIHMPVMDGIQFASEVRTLERAERRPRAPIIAVTADVLTSETERYVAAGIDERMQKPFSLAQLNEVLTRWLPCTDSSPREAAAAPARPATQTGTAEVLSLEAMRRSLGVIDGTAIALLNRYVESTVPLLADMLRAVAARSVADARRAAHSAVGASRTAGAEEFAGLCADLERAVIGEAWQDACTVGDRLEPAFARVREAVRRLGASGEGTADTKHP